MSTSNAIRFLASGGVDDELALEMYFNTVLESYYSQTILWNSAFAGGVGNTAIPPCIKMKTIDSGKSWQFILTADGPDSETHTPGTELLGQGYAFDEGNITIDSILVQHKDVPWDQLQMAHWDVIGPLARSMGRKLADGYDQRGFIIQLKAALTAAATKDGFTLHNGGNVVERIGANLAGAYPLTATGGRNFRDDAEQLAYQLDVDNVPESGRVLVIDPAIKNALLKDASLFDVRTNVDGQANSINKRMIGEIAGFGVWSSNNLPKTNITSSSLLSKGVLPTKYIGDYTYNGSGDGRPAALAFCGAGEGEAAIGCVAANMAELGPIYTFMGKDERRNTNFMKAQMMIGFDTLDVKNAGAIIVDDA